MTTALVPLRVNGSEPTALIGFAPAGAGGSAYRGWADYLDPEIALWGVRLPGRENRLAEKPRTRIADLIDPLTKEIWALTTPVAVFGHSFGSLLAYAVATALPTPPLWLGVSGLGPAMARDVFDEAYAEQIQIDPALLDVVLPALRADIQATRDYLPIDGPKVQCPVSVFGGAEDPLASREDLLKWRGFVAGEFGLRQYPGGHQFAIEQPQAVVADIIVDLRRAGQIRTVRAT